MCSACARASADRTGALGGVPRWDLLAGMGTGGAGAPALFGSAAARPGPLAGLSIADGPTTSAVLASASWVPSIVTRLTTISERPRTPAGILTFRVVRPNSGIAQTPDVMACPTERETRGGNPRRRMKLLGGNVSDGPTAIASEAWV